MVTQASKKTALVDHLLVQARRTLVALALVAEHTRHPRIHVIDEVTVEEPVAGFLVGEPLDRALTHRRNVDRVLQRREVSLAVEHAEEVPVKV